MKLHLARTAGSNSFTGYGPGYVAVNNMRYGHHLLVTPEHLGSWDIAGFEELETSAAQLMSHAPEIVIIGTGERLRFPPAALVAALEAAGIGSEAMDSRAACRTYNILIAEGRRVLAAILVE